MTDKASFETAKGLEHVMKAKELRCERPPLRHRLLYAFQVGSIQGLLAPIKWSQDLSEWFSLPTNGPSIVKRYETRRKLPVRIFFPASYDQTSSQTLPALFTIHGGGFCFGRNRENDEWNRTFADKFNVLVFALSYSKAPWSPFPGAIHDLEAVMLAIFADESLPIDRTSRTGRHGLSRTAILGFSAGGNLALTVTQLDSLRNHALAPAAAVSVYGCVDLSIPAHEKVRNRPFKPQLGTARGANVDSLLKFCPTFDWSYIPYGQDLRDPLLSPHYARREHLPPFVGLVAAELDCIGHEGWRLACRLSHEGVEAQGLDFAGKGRLIPNRESQSASERICGQQEPASPGVLLGLGGESNQVNERFAFEDNWEGGGVKWLLVPDVLHGFDDPAFREANAHGEKATIADAATKTALYMDEIGNWLCTRVWEL